MSATSGITVSNDLTQAFSDAVESKAVRFLKISIRNECLVPDDSIAPIGTLEEDLDTLGNILEDNVPAYILVRLDDPPSEWLAVSYVPDSAKVRDKMLYASTRNNLTKALGSTHFTDSLFATSKDDVTAAAYRKHKAHLAAPQPLTAREKELEAVKAAEREAGGAGYEASREKRSHIGDRVGFQWTEEADNAVKALQDGDDSRLVILTVDTSSECLQFASSIECAVHELSAYLPPSDPCYAFFAWPHTITPEPRRDIVYIYSCPTSSAVRNRMLYSSGARSTFHIAKTVLGATSLLERKIETSDPKELTEEYLKLELGLLDSNDAASAIPLAIDGDEKKPFARPKGPGRRK
ncbi:unnamed protein product [Somion occarium]|uniref:ADF-H domain-containing protein n=1 Tax=Somion occarium TaxID=3059160 RepID=A0ABP1DDC9_9APHY